jgi:DMSO reductase family type II enzyme chaperone
MDSAARPVIGGPAMSTDPRAENEAAVTHALQRAGIYRVLAGAFAYPTAPRIEELARASSTIAVGLPPGGVRDGLAALAAAAYVADAATLAGEYVFLFDRQVRCPAWESAWGDAPQMAGKPAALADVAGFYTAFGLEPAGGQQDAEDHIVPELEFMSALALKEAWARGERDRDGVDIIGNAARTFLTDHLGRWAECFAAELEAATPVSFYVAAARALAAWVDADVRAVDATPVKPQRRAAGDLLQSDTFSCPMAPEVTPAEVEPPA